MYLVLKKIEHPVTRDDYRFADGKKVVYADKERLSLERCPRTKAELEALFDCGMYGIEIVRRHSVRFELREAHRKGKTVRVERLWYGTVKLEDSAAVESFWRELERCIVNEKQAAIVRIRKQAEALIPSH